MSAARRSRLTRGDLGEAALLVVLVVVALSGLARTFTGAQFLLVGTVGALLGAGSALLARRHRWPPALPVLLAAAGVVLLGGPLCLRAAGGTPYLPVPGTLEQLGDAVVGGWRDALTTLPPVDGDGPLLVLPFVLGTAGALAAVLAAGLRRPPLAVQAVLVLAAPLLVLGVVLLLGVATPASVLLQGGAVAALALGAAGLRARRGAARAAAAAPVVPTVTGGTRPAAGRLRRGLTAAALVAVAGGLAVPVGSWAVGDDDRFVLREHVSPPFEVGQYPSPLAAFRRYVEMPEPDAANRYEQVLMTLDGAPEGTRVRFAALDSYDGVVWGAADRAAGTDGVGVTRASFQRVSTSIDNPVEGERVDVRVELGEGYDGVWLPTVGALTELRFAGPRADAAADSFRYNLATSTGVVPSGLAPGDAYVLEAVVPPAGADGLDEDDLPAAPDPALASAASFLATQAVQWTAGEAEPMARVLAAARHLRTVGKYTDGVLEAEKIYTAGHYRGRLGEGFVDDVVMAGNDEQYAATMALVANAIGVPARVVVGAVVPADGVVRGEHVEAWVELQVADGSWRTLPTEAFMDFDRPAERPPLNEQEMSGTVVPPPAPVPPPSSLADQTDAELDARAGSPEETGSELPAWVLWALGIVGGPLLLVALWFALVLGAKAWRRRRRRGAPRASARLVGAWRELVDAARDLGTGVPVAAGVTRREQARSLPLPAAPALARTADGHVFGPTPPADGVAADYWDQVMVVRRELRAGVPWHRRLRAAASLRSFRRT
ncbi:transglutaminase domain-containing protein [Nocardioides sp. ChNu-153]|uniref:transglutaminase-like domain-containing protein n=3 Tax=unclassified Nocardioides TaxID=2615069 RepID=UPI00264CE142|nr:transglutaminase-like domain-containing protein [Nocardioides sp. ChNu-153]MDN7121438.1 transglutaminase domain-containing protein [Nocardioides sp. ChNu-153]